MGGPPDRRRIEDFLTRLSSRIAEELVEWSGGVAYVHESLSKIWDANFLEVHNGSFTAEEIVRHVEEVFGETSCKHRRVCVRDPEAGAALEPDFRRLGWDVDVHVVMSHRREPNRIVDTSEVKELGAQTWPAREEQMRGYPFVNDEETIRQMRIFYDLVTEAAAGRDFGIIEEGKVVSFALLYSGGAIGQIEDVATLEAYRNRGYSWRVVMKTLEESRARHEMTFLIADDRDWPKDFYSKMGFDEVTRHYFFHKHPAQAKGPA